MGLTASPVVPKLDSVFISPAEWDPNNAVVWLRGEHDISTLPALREIMLRAIEHDDPDLTLDLSEVTFIDAATVGTIIRTLEFLRFWSRSLTLRSPSRCVRRVLELCDLVDLGRSEATGSVAGERRLRILNRLVGNGAPELETRRLCEVCAEVTDMTGAGLMLMSGDVPRGSVCTTNDVSAHIEQWQDAFGEGPCVDAYRRISPVLEPNLAHPATLRWLAFAPPAVEAGVQAVFGFPLQVGAVRLGALNLYCDRTGTAHRRAVCRRARHGRRRRASAPRAAGQRTPWTARR
jgi:anti-anti-sigma factor